MKEIFHNEYLNAKLEKHSDEKSKTTSVYNKPEGLLNSFINHSYENGEKSFEFVKGDTKAFFSYEPIDELERDALPAFLYGRLIELKEKYPYVMTCESKVLFPNVCILKEFTLENGNNRLDLRNIFPDGRIYFNFSKPFTTLSSAFNPSQNMVALTKDPLTSEGLLALFHEIGHYQDEQRGETLVAHSFSNNQNSHFDPYDVGALIPVGYFKEDRQAKKLKAERSAWAFTLSNLRPYLKDLGINYEDVKQFIHNYCLQSYSDVIREE